MNLSRIIAGILVLLALIPVRAGASDASNVAILREGDLSTLGPIGWHAPEFSVPAGDASVAPVDPKDESPGAVLLRRLILRGMAGGFDGILYDNRDRGHSTLAASLFPGLHVLAYDDALRKRRLDYGLAGQVILPAIVFGNSSTAMTSGAAARSQPRLAMTSPLGPQRAYLTYSNNHIYVYPEHRDHDAADLFPANWPYTIISQGSSGSDGPFLVALAMTLAAFTDETKAFLRDNKLVSPTVQMILRRSLSHVYSRAAYLSGAAHPVVFTDDMLAPERMVALASALKPSEVPPMVRLDVEQETFSATAGLAKLSERLFTTPSAIARLWRSLEAGHEMTVSAARTADPNGRDLKFSWVLLQGDPDKVDITPLDAAGRRARIRIAWHDQWRSGAENARLLSRVDIGVFAWNGAHDSAPAIISIKFPTHQRRRYETGGDGEPRLAWIDYDADARDEYYDPWLYWQAGWQDEFRYDETGDPTDWIRHFPDRDVILMNGGAPAEARLPEYRLIAENGRPRLVEVAPEPAGN